ncbi:MAG: OpgC domain-containing protein [Thiotrichaceae bacterium]
MYFIIFYGTNEIWSDIHAMLELYVIKTNLGLLRIHFLALAYVINFVLHRDAQWLNSFLAQKFVLMGQQGLPIFSLGYVVVVYCWNVY